MSELAAAAVLLALGWSHGPGGLALAITGLSLAWVISRLWWPYKPCRRCKGTGRNLGSNGRRHGDCRRCKGTRRVRRFGARAVHRARLALLNLREK
jgi:hypothetical protein